MTSEVAYIPGERPAAAGPLRRYLPPISNGVAAAWLRAHLPPGAWVLDPFGASPRLAIEAARAGYRVLAAVNNPIGRFLLDLHADPPTEDELRLALAELSAAQKSGERLEPHLRSLYRTHCQNCGAEVEAQAFVWERGAETPAARIYACPHCKDSGERPATHHDAERARRFAGGALHRARALERVAPLDDPDRIFVEEALGMYLPRAVYALFTLVNKLESFPAERRRGLEALLLAAFDACSTLWAHPATRARPRQLVTPPRFVERNVWLALEDAAAAWPAALRGPDPAAGPTPLTTWPALPPEAGGICIFDGRLRDLAAQMAASGRPGPPQGTTPDRPADAAESEHAPADETRPAIEIAALLSALPRPNQAFWTLSALWAGWLWGHEASAAFKSVLRRRRYDWDWHAAALHANLQHIPGMAAPGLPALALIGEAEPGFLSAALLAGERAGFGLRGLALRGDEAQAQIAWELGAAPALKPSPRPEAPPAELVQQAALETLEARREPCAYLPLHAGILEQLVQAGLWPAPEDSLEAALSHLNATLELALAANRKFIRSGGSSRSLEVGLWWAAPSKSGGADLGGAPLADRVEMAVVRYLVKRPGAVAEQVDAAVCAAFPGRLTPERELVEQILASYTIEDEAGLRRLRAEDTPAARADDLNAMQALLQAAGKRLGFTVRKAAPLAERQAVRWAAPGAGPGYDFFVIASAVAGELLLHGVEKTSPRPVLVLPGGRAALMAYKLRRDPRLQHALDAGWRLVKYRHMRRLAEDPSVTPENLDDWLRLDPLDNRDAQMALL